MRLIVIDTVAEFLSHLAGVTGRTFSLYDQRARLLIPLTGEDPLLKPFISSEAGKGAFEQFLKNSIEKALLRKTFSLFKGPFNQYHCFCPLLAGNEHAVLIGKSFYVSKEDREEGASKALRFGIPAGEVRSWDKQVVLHDLKREAESYAHINNLVTQFLHYQYERNLLREKNRKKSTIIDLVSEFERITDRERVFGLLSEAIMLLFGGDTIALVKQHDETFVPVYTAGRHREQIKGVLLQSGAICITEVLKSRVPRVCGDTIELLRFGYSNEIQSMHLFPLSGAADVPMLLIAYNSPFSQEDVADISKLCTLTSAMLKNRGSSALYGKCLKDLEELNFATGKLSPMFQDPDSLYDAIVDISAALMNAEKVSLMLPEEDRTELFIRAVKGINKWIAKNIRVRVGEGIAGRVYKEGKPMVVGDIEKHIPVKRRPSYRTNSFISIPLKLGDETIGVLNLADKITGEVFTEADMSFLRYFASYASIVIKGAQYYSISEEMRTLSITDSLTGLFNRRYFDNRLYEELQRAIRYDSLFSLAIFDIDDFKLFNDTEGHPEGDEILKAIASISRESLRSIDILARFGGEEFSIIMPQTDRDEAFLVAERVRQNIKEMMPLCWKQYPRKNITVSVGIATFPADGKEAKALIKSADRALYQAKVSGKDRTILCENNPLSMKVPLRNHSEI